MFSFLTDSKSSAYSDVYSLGLVFYEMITGQLLFLGDTVSDIIKQILVITPVEPKYFRPEISNELNQLMMKMIEKEPE